MRKLVKKRAGTRGLPPGAIVHVGEKKSEEVKISIIDYSIGIYISVSSFSGFTLLGLFKYFSNAGTFLNS